MAQLFVNGSYFMNGKFTVSRNLITRENGEETILVEGTLCTHDYIEELKSIESYRYIVKNINVTGEGFGSDDYDILYKFTAEGIEIKGVRDGDLIRILSKEEQQQIEKIKYRKDNEIFGDIGEEYKELFKDEQMEGGE